MISFNNSIIDVVCLPFRGNYVTQDRDGHVARVHRGIDAQASIPTGKAKPALASQEPALTLRNGFPGGKETQYYFSLFHHPGKTTDELWLTPRVFAEGHDLPVLGRPPLV